MLNISKETPFIHLASSFIPSIEGGPIANDAIRTHLPSIPIDAAQATHSQPSSAHRCAHLFVATHTKHLDNRRDQAKRTTCFATTRAQVHRSA